MSERKYPYVVTDGLVVAMIRNAEDLARWRRETRICCLIIIVAMLAGLGIIIAMFAA